MQPMAADDVVQALARATVADATTGTHEIGGPRAIPMPELMRLSLAASGDPRTVIGDPEARYFGTHVTDLELCPGEGAELSRTDFSDWLAAAVPAAH